MSTYYASFCVAYRPADGTDPVIPDLTNENSLVACDSEGNVTGEYETTRFMLMQGTTDIADEATVTLEADGITAVYDSSTHVITVSGLTQDSAAVTVNAVYGGEVYTVYYRVKKLYAGADGETPTVYSLALGMSCIPVDADGALKSSTLGVSVKKTTGDSTETLTGTGITSEGLYVRYTADGGSTKSSPTTSSSACYVTLSASCTYYTVYLYSDSSLSNVIDQETVYQVADGADGEKGDTGESGADGASFTWNVLTGTKDFNGWTASSAYWTMETDDEGFANAVCAAPSAQTYSALLESPRLPLSLIDGKTVTLTAWVKTDDADTFNASTSTRFMTEFQLYADTSSSRILYGGGVSLSSGMADGEWTALGVTRTIGSGVIASGSGDYGDAAYFAVRFYNYSLSACAVKRFKLEIGDSATDWSPHPDDLTGETGEKGDDGPSYTFTPSAVTLDATADEDGYPDGGLGACTLAVNGTTAATALLAYDNSGEQVTIDGVSLASVVNCTASVSSSKVVITPTTRSVSYTDASGTARTSTLAYSSGSVTLNLTIGEDTFAHSIGWSGDVSLVTGGLAWDKALLSSVYTSVTANTTNISTLEQTADSIKTSLSSYVTNDDLTETLSAYSTVEQTADSIKTSLSSYVTNDDLTETLSAYSTVEQTADSISASVDDLTDDLAATGIDITSGKIALTANDFTVSNQSGQLTMDMGENGEVNFYTYSSTSDTVAASTLTLTGKSWCITFGLAKITAEIRADGIPVMYGYDSEGALTWILPESAAVVDVTITAAAVTYTAAASSDTNSLAYYVTYSLTLTVNNNTASAVTIGEDITATATLLSDGTAADMGYSEITVKAGASQSVSFSLEQTETVSASREERITGGSSSMYVYLNGESVASVTVNASAS